MIELEQSAYLWNLEGDVARLGARLREGGCQTVYVKGADGSDLWDHVGFSVKPLAREVRQVRPWMFNYSPTVGEIAACVAMVRMMPTDVVMLNPEIHAAGRWHEVSNKEAAAWVKKLRQALAKAFGTAPQIGFSSCPSWDGDARRGAPWFPYEGFAEECDGPLMPQHYWHPETLDMIEYSNRRTPAGKMVIPILAACRDWEPSRGEFWPTAAIIDQAADLIPRCVGLSGLSSWRVDRADYDVGAMAHAYQLLATEAARRAAEEARKADPVRAAFGRLQDFWAMLPGQLQGTDSADVRYYFRADFSRWDQSPAAVGLKGEYLTIWTAPNDEQVRAVQPELFAEALADRLVERV